MDQSLCSACSTQYVRINIFENRIYALRFFKIYLTLRL